jgi:hypothetical protein
MHIAPELKFGRRFKNHNTPSIERNGLPHMHVAGTAIEKPNRSTRVPRLSLTAALVWSIVVAAGFAGVMNYEATPGPAAQTPRDWPPASKLERARDRAHLVLFAHPHCPCTQAGVEELAKVLGVCPGRATVDVFFITPERHAPDWEATKTWRSAAAIPGVRVRADAGGVEAGRFGVQTSGHVVLFDRHGATIFSGGITARRGEAGCSDGTLALTALLNGKTAPCTETPVFGCPLFDPE